MTHILSRVLISHPGFVTDWTDSPNMFCLLLASPPPVSAPLNLASKNGPEGHQYKMPWFVRESDDGEKLMLGEDDPDLVDNAEDSDDETFNKGKQGLTRRKGWKGLGWGRS